MPHVVLLRIHLPYPVCWLPLSCGDLKPRRTCIDGAPAAFRETLPLGRTIACAKASHRLYALQLGNTKTYKDWDDMSLFS